METLKSYEKGKLKILLIKEGVLFKVLDKQLNDLYRSISYDQAERVFNEKLERL